MITELIDKQDTAEVVRDKIAAILAVETAAQVALATTAGKPDPSLWHFRVFQERSDPWDSLRPGPDNAPIVNVTWDSSTFDPAASNIVERQKSDGIFHIDCYALGQSSDVDGGGQITGDRDAAENVQRVVRLVRNILMAAPYTYLDLRRTVWRRWVESITTMRPQQDDANAHRIIAARLSFRVEFSEYSPQVEPETLEAVSLQVSRTEDNEVIIDAEYVYPLT